MKTRSEGGSQCVCTIAVVSVLFFAVCLFAAQQSTQKPIPQPNALEEARTCGQPSICDQHGVKLAQSGDLSAAIEQFRSALRISPNYADAWYHLGLAYDQARDTDQAMTGFQEALRLQPDYVEARYMLADCCRKRGDFDGELNLLAQVVARAPQFAEAHYNYGLALKNREKLQLAVEELRAAVRLSPGNTKYMLALGVALADVDTKEAVAVLRGAVQHGADTADAHYNLGLALAGQSDFEGASQQFGLALQLQSQDANAEANLGAALAELGRFQEAKSHFERALQIDPKQPIAKDNLDALQKEMNSH